MEDAGLKELAASKNFTPSVFGQQVSTPLRHLAGLQQLRCSVLEYEGDGRRLKNCPGEELAQLDLGNTW